MVRKWFVTSEEVNQGGKERGAAVPYQQWLSCIGWSWVLVPTGGTVSGVWSWAVLEWKKFKKRD